MLKLPDKLAAEFSELCGGVQPLMVARALTNLDGGSGATWMATEGSRIIFFYRLPGGGDFEAIHYAFNEPSSFDVDEDGSFAYLKAGFSDRDLNLKFSIFDHATLLQFQEQWKPPTGTGTEAAPAVLTPMLAFCAAMQAIAQSDNKIDSAEMEWLSAKLLDKNALRRGGAWLRDNNVDKLITQCARLMHGDQRRCLISNLISLAMADGLYRSKESELIEKFRVALEISEDEFTQLYDPLMARNNVGIFMENPDRPDEPVASEAINLFCACFLCLIEFDGQPRPMDEGRLRKLVNNPEAVNEARTYVEQLGAEGLCDALPGPLDERQCRCLMLNLVAQAMADGVLSGRKQELLELFRVALGISEESYQADFNGFITMNNLSVLISR